MARWVEKSGLFRTLAALAVVLAALPTMCASSLTPWPYLQVYPPVNESDDSSPLYFALVLSSGGQYTRLFYRHVYVVDGGARTVCIIISPNGNLSVVTFCMIS